MGGAVGQPLLPTLLQRLMLVVIPQLIEVQAEYHRKSLTLLQAVLPQIKAQQGERKPCLGQGWGVGSRGGRVRRARLLEEADALASFTIRTPSKVRVSRELDLRWLVPRGSGSEAKHAGTRCRPSVGDEAGVPWNPGTPPPPSPEPQEGRFCWVSVSLGDLGKAA